MKPQDESKPASCALCAKPLKATLAQTQGLACYHYNCATAVGIDHGPKIGVRP